MSVVAFTALWLAASAPAVPATESGEVPPAPTARGPADGYAGPKAGPPSATSAKKTGPNNDEPDCEE